MQSISGLNGSYCENLRHSRIVTCEGTYGSSLSHLVKLMLREEEEARPDFKELKTNILILEYQGFVYDSGDILGDRNKVHLCF